MRICIVAGKAKNDYIYKNLRASCNSFLVLNNLFYLLYVREC